MRNKYLKRLIVSIITILSISVFFDVVTAETDIQVEFFYNTDCTTCIKLKPTINRTKEYYGDNISLISIVVDSEEHPENYTLWNEFYGFSTYPAVVVKNITEPDRYTRLEWDQITYGNLMYVLDGYLNESAIPTNNNSNNTDDKKQENETPGFEIVMFFLSILIIFTMINYRKKQ